MSSERDRKMELAIGQKICEADLQNVENDKQMRQYKRECFSKEMRECW